MIFFLYKSIMIMDGLNLQYLNNFSLLFWKIDKLSFTKSKSFKIIVRKQGSCSMSMEKNEWVNWNFYNSVFYQLNNSIKKSGKALKRKIHLLSTYFKITWIKINFFQVCKKQFARSCIIWMGCWIYDLKSKDHKFFLCLLADMIWCPI